MYVHREFNHLVSRNTLSLVFWVRQTSVRKSMRLVELFCCHGGEWRVYDNVLIANLLQDSLCTESVRLLLDMPYVLRLRTLVL